MSTPCRLGTCRTSSFHAPHTGTFMHHTLAYSVASCNRTEISPSTLLSCQSLCAQCVKIYSFHVAQLSFAVPVGEETICSLCSEVHRMGECAQSLSPVSLRTPSRPLCAVVLLHVRKNPAAVRRLLNNSCLAVLLRCKAIAKRQVGSRKTRRGTRGRPQST